MTCVSRITASGWRRRVHETVTGDPDADGAEPPPRPVPTTVCTQCMKQVPLPSTQITANGVVCDPCFTRAR